MDYETWNQHKNRPVWVRAHRDELDGLTGDDADRVPDSMADVHDWVDRYDSVVSRALNNDEGAGTETEVA